MCFCSHSGEKINLTESICPECWVKADSGKKAFSAKSIITAGISLFLAVILLLCLSVEQGASQEKEIRNKGALFPIVVNGKWGYMDKTGKIVIRPRFDFARGFSEGLAQVQSGDQGYCYIYKTGRVAIKLNPQTEYAMDFSEGLARIKIGDKCGYINRTGRIVIKPKFDLAFGKGVSGVPYGYFHEGLAPVSIDRKWGYIDKTGKFVIKPQFNIAFNFHEGLALVRIGKDFHKYGYINKTGKFVIKPQFDCARSFHEGLAAAQVSSRSGYINRSGKFVIKPQFCRCESFSEGLAPVEIVSSEPGKRGRWGYINKAGRMVIKPKFDCNPFIDIVDSFGEISSEICFSEGLAAVMISDKYGYIDQTGKIVIQPRFDGAAGFQKGLAKVKIGDNWGYINKTGKFIWKPTR